MKLKDIIESASRLVSLVSVWSTLCVVVSVLWKYMIVLLGHGSSWDKSMLSHSTITRISLLVWSLMRVDFVCRYDRNAPYRELFEAVEDFEWISRMQWMYCFFYKNPLFFILFRLKHNKQSKWNWLTKKVIHFKNWHQKIYKIINVFKHQLILI